MPLQKGQTDIARPALARQGSSTRTSTRGGPIDALTESQKRGSGRNNNGHITMRHKGGGHKHHYRIVDYKRDKDGIPAKVERLEYDPNRSAHLALLLYVDGERRYIVAPRGVTVGTQLMSGAEAPIKPGNCLPVRNIRSARRCTASSFSPARARSSPAPRARRCSSWRAKASTRRCACARARSARFTSIAAR
jgi:large subunit ribosomal protein L2